jgi:Domain of unknown function (DUF5979)
MVVRFLLSCYLGWRPVPGRAVGWSQVRRSVAGSLAGVLLLGSMVVLSATSAAGQVDVQDRSTFLVHKVFSDHSTAEVTVSLSCTPPGGVDPGGDTTASEADPANFSVFRGGQPTTCTATETVPAGYTGSGSPPGTCSATVNVTGETVNCTITNTLIEPEHEVTVTKAVVGTPPAGATFKVEVDCGDDHDKTLTFDATGGTSTFELESDDPLDCTVSEPQTGGATRVSIACDEGDNADCEGTDSFSLFDDPSEGDAEAHITVTNVFAVVADPTFTG